MVGAGMIWLPWAELSNYGYQHSCGEQMDEDGEEARFAAKEPAGDADDYAGEVKDYGKDRSSFGEG
jgi:hypothetical protein